MATASKEKKEKKSPPAERFSTSNDGSRIEVGVWKNRQDGEYGERVFYSVSFQRSFKTEEGWKTVTSMRKHDIPVLQYLLGKAYDYCMTQGEEE